MIDLSAGMANGRATATPEAVHHKSDVTKLICGGDEKQQPKQAVLEPRTPYGTRVLRHFIAKGSILLRPYWGQARR